MSIDPASYGAIHLHEHERVEWNLPINHWSPSSLEMFWRCPYQWQQRYIRGRKSRPGEATSLGSAVHRAIEENFKQKIASQEDLPIIPLLDQYAEEFFPRQIEREQEASGFEIEWKTSYDQARQRGKVMLASYQGEVAPRVQPLETEGTLRVDMGLPVPVEGRFDVEKHAGVIDVKTGSSKTSKPKESWRIQAAVYAKAKQKPVEFHSVTATIKTGTVNIVTPLESPAMLVHPTQRERSEMERSIAMISDFAVQMMARYGPDEDWPAVGRFHTWACDYCGYRAGCPAWEDTA